MTTAPRKHDLLTVILEDYFHVGALHGLITPRQWDRFEPRYEANTLATLELLKGFDVKATFFVLGWIAQRRPDLVAEVAKQGHEIANYGFLHRNVRQMTREEFRDDSRRSRDALESAIGKSVIGYRIPQGLRSRADWWMLDVLAEERYAYDSSVIPGHDLKDPQHRSAFQYCNSGGRLWEFPYPTANLGGFLLPIAGGNYFRQIPHTLLKHAVANWKESFDSPYMMYFHVWELDPDQPRITATSWLTRTRQYRKLKKMSWLLPEYFRNFRFGSIADYLGEDVQAVAPHAVTPKDHAIEVKAELPAPKWRIPVSVVVPCCNERAALPYLANTLESVQKLLGRDYRVSFIFVDDGSTDGTWELLNQLFGDKENFRLIQHPQNRGVAAAILTGIRHADSEIVCSIDCDCSYDPHDLTQMLPLMTGDVDMVTASPYHHDGKVMNVPGWRLGLSKGASWLYGKVLRHKLSTYTSCFRVYRRSKVIDLQLKELGFLGVAETLGLLDLKGARIVEFPATLQVRILGHSKMKVLRTIVGHLKNLARLYQMRRLVEHERLMTVHTPAPEVVLHSQELTLKVKPQIGSYRE